jgi:DNA invertase Pin-like site-specific DNA recombinase
MNVGYIRVSSITQNLESQKKTIEDKFGTMDRWFEEKVSGRSKDREALKDMIDYVREGDVIHVLDLSRVSRSLKDLLDLLDIFQNKDVGINAVKDTYDINSLSGKLLVQIMGAVNEFQVNIQREKQLEGIALAKTQGKYKNCGRKKNTITETEKELYSQWNQGIITQQECMSELGISRTTLHRKFTAIKENVVN